MGQVIFKINIYNNNSYMTCVKVINYNLDVDITLHPYIFYAGIKNQIDLFTAFIYTRNVIITSVVVLS